jgi:hypothetical protein
MAGRLEKLYDDEAACPEESSCRRKWVLVACRESEDYSDDSLPELFGENQQE